jgi:hypothetical protein
MENPRHYFIQERSLQSETTVQALVNNTNILGTTIEKLLENILKSKFHFYGL